MKQKFDLSVWLKDKSRKVCTRDGNIAEIIYTNGKGRFPVIVIDPYEEETEPWQVTENGKFYCNGDDDKLDLFFADEDEELTEFEKELINAFNDAQYHTASDGKVFAKKYKEKLIFLARKETLKYSPKWKKVPSGITRKELFNMMHKSIVTVFKGCKDYYYLDKADLEKLPKEE